MRRKEPANDPRAHRRARREGHLSAEDTNTREREESHFYLAAGSTAAILLGVALLPLRSVASASNLALAFVALTIVVAELGGRWAAVVTAACSALSLNFFL